MSIKTTGLIFPEKTQTLPGNQLHFQEDTVPPLPDDIWIKLSTYLSLKESCSLALGNKKMSVRARYHIDWKHFTPNWDKLLKTGAAQLFASPNFKMIKKLTLLSSSGYMYNTADISLIMEVLQCSLTCDTLNVIKFNGNVSGVDEELLATAISKLVGVSFRGFRGIAEIQLTKVMERALSTKKLSKLTLKEVPVTLKNVELLGEMVSQLNKLKVYGSLTTDHVKWSHLLDKCIQSSTLTHLKLHGINLTKIPSKTLAGLCDKLQKVALPYCQLDTEQINNFLIKCSTSSTLKAIDITCWNLSDISPKLLSLALSNLNEVQMWKNRTSRDHHVEIISRGFLSMKLKTVSVSEYPGSISGWTPVELVSSEPRLLHVRLPFKHALGNSAANAILTNSLGNSCLYKLDLNNFTLNDDLLPTLIRVLPQLHTINLCHTRLTTKKLNYILNALKKSTKIRKLDLSENRLKDVSADLLFEVAGKLDEIVVEACGLTKEHSTKILQTSAICHLNLNDLSSLSKEDIYKNMERNKLYNATSLTSEQITFMLETFCKEQGHLWEFHMDNQNLSKVPFDLLTRFASKCGEVSFSYCKLTKQQENILETFAKPQWKQLKRLHVSSRNIQTK